MGKVDRLRLWTVFGWWSGGVGQGQQGLSREGGEVTNIFRLEEPDLIFNRSKDSKEDHAKR